MFSQIFPFQGSLLLGRSSPPLSTQILPAPPFWLNPLLTRSYVTIEGVFRCLCPRALPLKYRGLPGGSFPAPFPLEATRGKLLTFPRLPPRFASLARWSIFTRKPPPSFDLSRDPPDPIR